MPPVRRAVERRARRCWFVPCYANPEGRLRELIEQAGDEFVDETVVDED
jgi:hypothetical protein